MGVELEEVAVRPTWTLLDTLREVLGLTGTKKSCETGDCGACTVLVDGEPMCSCLVLAVRAQGKQIETIVSKGAAGGMMFATNDCRGSYEELKGRGVEFTQEPTEQPYGIDAAFRDPSGNQARLVQAR